MTSTGTDENIFESEPGRPTGVAKKVEPVTPGAGLLTGADGKTYVARAFIAETSGTMSFQEIDGTNRTGFPVAGGATPTPIAAKRVTAFTGTNLWAVRV